MTPTERYHAFVKRRLAAGLVRVVVWIPAEALQKLKAFVLTLNRGAGGGGEAPKDESLS